MKRLELSADDVLMLPRYSIVSSRKDVALHPFIFSAPMDTVTGYTLTKAMLDLGELAVVCRFLPEQELLNTYRDFATNERCYVAVGALDEERLDVLLAKFDRASVDLSKRINVAIDLAVGCGIAADKTLELLLRQPWIGDVMSGSICTAEQAQHLVERGCKTLRVGIGPGAACTTRMMTGVGRPQFAAVEEIANEMAMTVGGAFVNVIADGGIRTPGDAAKYLGAGASHIMLGRRLCQTKESAGWITEFNLERLGQKGPIIITSDEPYTVYKHYRGQASAPFQLDQFGQSNRCPEGAASDRLHPHGTVEDVVEEFRGGVRSACSYLGIDNFADLNPDNVEFVQVTGAGYREGTPHGT